MPTANSGAVDGRNAVARRSRPFFNGRREHRRHAEQKREPRRGLALQSEHHAQRHRRARSRDAGNEGDRLRDADADGLAVRQRVLGAAAGAEPFGTTSRPMAPTVSVATSGAGVAHRSSRKSANATPTMTAGIVPTMIRRSRCALAIGRGRASARQRRGHAEQVAPEVDDDGGQRADVTGDVEGEPERFGVPAEERAREDQVRRARNRQELRESLDDAEHRRGDEIHVLRGLRACGPVSSTAVGAGCGRRRRPSTSSCRLSMTAIAEAMKIVE